MIGMILGWTMIEGVTAFSARNHSDHLIREIIVPDALLPNSMRGEVRVKGVEGIAYVKT